MSSLRQLKVTFDSFDDLVESIGPGLSRTHLFLPLAVLQADARADDAIDDGTRLRLEIGTVRKGALIRGVAKVAGSADDPSEPGLRLHLIHLDPSSTRLVDSIVRGEIAGEELEATGHSPFDIPGTEPEGEPEPAAADAVPEPAEPPVLAAPAPHRRFAWPLALAAVAGLFLLVFELAPGGGKDDSQLLTGRDRQTEVARPAPRAAEEPTEKAGAESSTAERSSPEEPAVERDPAALGAPAAESETPDPAAAMERVEGAVRAWAQAWSRQDPNAYLELYAADYSPSGLARDAWEIQRRARITAPEQLEIGVRDLEVEIAGPDRAIARFQQLYITEEKTLSARKVLELERFTAGWKIVAERMER